jgi:Rap1a immunity proteins
LLLLVVAVLSLPSWCIAQNNDGNNLLADCEALITMIDAGGQSFPTDKVAGASRCGGLMEGMLQMNDTCGLKGATMFFCRPTNSTAVQAARIVVKYLHDHPEQLHEDEVVLA